MKTTLVFFSIICINTITFFNSKAQAINARDSLALVNFFDSTNGSNWFRQDNWKTSLPVNHWGGVVVKNGRVTSIMMNGNNITGHFPSSFGNLDSLKYLTLIDNKITGNIPETFGNLSALVGLDLGANYLTGNIPATIGNIATLETLDLYSNRFTGDIPASFTNLKKLNSADFTNCQLNGSIPAALASVWSLQVQNNHFRFNAIEQLVQAFSANSNNTLLYHPQANIKITQQNGQFSVAVGGSPSNNQYKWYKVGTGLIDTIQSDSTFKPTSTGNYYVTVTNAIATLLTLYSDTVAATSVEVRLCPDTANFNLTSNVTGPAYQWQLRKPGDTSFFNISDTNNYAGTNASTLSLVNIPSAWYGYQYRCITSSSTSVLFTLAFINKYAAIGNTTWESPANWSCGKLPDRNTDVIITTGTVVLNNDVEIRTLKLLPGVIFSVAAGSVLIITHK
ncbi:MAG: hypothetical protein ABIN01_17525 [Ferruginibacter sp.]